MAENPPQVSTIKEALIAELLSDLHVAIQKTEEAINSASEVEETISGATKALIVAAERYKTVINQFTNEAKNDISAHIKLETINTTTPLIKTLTEKNRAFLENGFKKLKQHQNLMFSGVFILIALNLFMTVFLVLKLMPV